MEEEKRKDQMQKYKNEKYRAEILDQMNERETKRREMLQQTKDEFAIAREKEEERLR